MVDFVLSLSTASGAASATSSMSLPVSAIRDLELIFRSFLTEDVLEVSEVFFFFFLVGVDEPSLVFWGI